ncbi:DEK domain-containing chromatin-associated protein 1-like [Gastrolobium bilobum]|uniref:DEK domain-containing chromatin-associated protein 1-like n=1 Tax=Gastrolobium bilobum TaxID=150636 RepID=UPI002AB27E5B|nr:DEK domain-containing chromatin-associated protein 1-like [Gastrolobium bilobum]
MTSKTLEDDKPQGEEALADEDQSKQEEEEEEEEMEDRAKVKSNKSNKENDPTTPTSERPSRERKKVDRYTVSSPEKFPRFSSRKALSIEMGHGTQLKDIPNVVFKLAKRKPDDNLRTLHSILFGKKEKAQNLKRNIGLFSGYVWAENEEKQRAKIREKIDKCVKEKLVDFCDVLNIPINKTGMKKEELSAKLLEFLESPHATTDVLLADKEKKGKKRATKATPSKSSGEASEKPAKKHKQTSQVGKKRKQFSDIEEDDTAELSDVMVDSQEDEDISVPKSESNNEESQSEEEEDKQKAHKSTSKQNAMEIQSTPVKKTTDEKAAKSNEKTPKKSNLKTNITDGTSASFSKSKQSASKKQKTVRENQGTTGKTASKSSKPSVKDQGKGKGGKKAKTEPSWEDMHRVVADILKEVDFETTTLSDILGQLGTHFGLDLIHRKAEVKDIVTDVISNMSSDEDEEVEEVENDANDDDA